MLQKRITWLPTKRLTDRSIAAASSPDSAYTELWDAVVPSFGVRINRGGRKTFHVMRRVNSKTRRFKLGTYPAMSLADARDKARALLAELAAGRDPKIEAAKLARQAGVRSRRQFGQVAAAFIDDHVSKLRTAHETARVIRTDLVAEFSDWPIDEISRDHIRNWLRHKAKTSPVMANRCLGHMRRIMNWAIDEGLLDSSPTARIKPPAVEVHRERVLSNDELRAIWIAAEHAGFPAGPSARLLILTCQRRSEIVGMKWTELDLEAAAWTVPQGRSKSGAGHVVPLSRPAVDVLANVPRIDGFAHVFVSGRVGDKPVSGYSKMKRRLDALSGVTDWRLHDLRRTGATGMRSLGVDRLTVSKVLNHAEQGVTAIYDRYAEDKEKRQALERWGAHVLRLAADQKAVKVVSLGLPK